MVTSTAASGGAQITVGPHGAITMPRGVVAGGDVDQSRVYHFRFGGLVAMLAAVAIAAAAISAVTTYVVVTPKPASASPEEVATDYFIALAANTPAPLNR